MAPKKQGSSMDDVSHKIGLLEGQLEALIAAVVRSDTDARQSRSKLFVGQEQMRLEMADANIKIAGVVKSWEEAGPVITEIKKWKERFIGMQMLLTLASTGLLAGAVYAWKWLSIKLGA
jgi:hypothetical protein